MAASTARIHASGTLFQTLTSFDENGKKVTTLASSISRIRVINSDEDIDILKQLLIILQKKLKIDQFEQKKQKISFESKKYEQYQRLEKSLIPIHLP